MFNIFDMCKENENANGLMHLKFIFQDHSLFEVKGKSFREAVAFVVKSKMVFNNEPFKVEFTKTNKVLYFNKSAFYAYFDNELSEPELLQLTQCDGLYRNNTKLKTNTNEEIDKGALWMLRDKFLYLIDDDDTVKSEYLETLFYKV